MDEELSNITRNNKCKIMLFDIDGVIISKNQFSTRFSRDFSVPMEKINPFFQNRFRLCSTGKADLKEEIEKYFQAWNWTGSVDKLLSYWFEGERQVDEKVLGEIAGIRQLGIKCYLVSDQEKYRADFLLNDLGLEKLFDGHFISYQLGYLKTESNFFKKVISELNVSQKEKIIYWDDEESKLKAAKTLGIDVRLYTNFDDFKKEIIKIS